MPPHGLYRIPKHYLAGSSPRVQRHTYSSMDFQDDEPAPVHPDGDRASTVYERASRKKEKRERKEKRKLKKMARETQTAKEVKKLEDVSPPPLANRTLATPIKSGRYGPRGPYKKKEKTPNDAHVFGMKGKTEESGTHAEKAAVTGHDVSSNTPFLGPDFLQGLKECHPGFTFSQKVNSNEIAGESAEKKKRGRMVETRVPIPSVAKSTTVSIPGKISYGWEGSRSEGQPKSIKPPRFDSQVLVAETPPSQICNTPTITTPRQPPIPFSLQPKKTGPGVVNTDMSLSEYAAPAPAKHIISSQGSVFPFTSSQATSSSTSSSSSKVMSYRQPLLDKPKLRIRHRAVSVAASSTSSSTSTTTRSIKDMFARAGKPSTRPESDYNPFSIEPKKPGRHIERHSESSLAVFTAAFTTVQATVNFTDESGYLSEYDELAAASSGPLPCLHKATGCTLKGEHLLRLSCEEAASSVLQMTDTGKSNTRLAKNAIYRCQEAETFLRNSMAARIPVPIGVIEGVWSLYCPSYSTTHVDKYGLGQRTLSIHGTADASQHGGVYTARLGLPPRSIAFAMGEFAGPPHASFRSVGLKTVSEGYRVDVVFLGNGYAKVRLDLHLLLMGKVAAGIGSHVAGAGKAFEFLAVHQQAIVWKEAVDGLEVEKGKLVTGYDG